MGSVSTASDIPKKISGKMNMKWLTLRIPDNITINGEK